MKTWMGLLCVLLLGATVIAQEETAAEEESSFHWITGPAKGRLSDISTLEIPEGYAFLDEKEAGEYMRSQGNLVTGREIGVLVSISNNWLAVFEFDPIGYVKDDEKNDLDADALMKSLRESQAAANSRLAEMGASQLEIDGWYKKPFYNENTQNLEWCTQLREKGGIEPFANHNIRILGRYGVTEIVLVAGMDQLDSAIPELASVLESYDYAQGKKYAEYRKGDKIAKYGLTALVAGGAAAIAVKSGLLKHLWKLLILGAAGVSGFFKKMKSKKNADLSE